MRVAGWKDIVFVAASLGFSRFVMLGAVENQYVRLMSDSDFASEYAEQALVDATCHHSSSIRRTLKHIDHLVMLTPKPQNQR